ncbi:hypothetical protein HII28_02910 [Planctomonas sp. JC2975]|uniref:hypothetical protein n=1 Tax=Planctomonas sp. JC2975 TaxID=2729626 RepID=UPI0014739A46|nr:hypothetical protein [Planctomonas sp. JC2975]NNC10833.1 hypothetical protein [Planctomonas sp. JC2975]
MQLGTRWPVGGAAPDRLPSVVVSAVRSVEDELEALDVDASTWRWTLTWLEGKPVVELDDGTVIRYHPEEDSATVSQPDEEALEAD